MSNGRPSPRLLRLILAGLVLVALANVLVFEAFK